MRKMPKATKSKPRCHQGHGCDELDLRCGMILVFQEDFLRINYINLCLCHVTFINGKGTVLCDLRPEVPVHLPGWDLARGPAQSVPCGGKGLQPCQIRQLGHEIAQKLDGCKW